MWLRFARNVESRTVYRSSVVKVNIDETNKVKRELDIKQMFPETKGP